MKVTHSVQNKFDALLRAMLTKPPKASGKKQAKTPSSSVDASEDYAETQIREDTSEDVSSTPKYVSP